MLGATRIESLPLLFVPPHAGICCIPRLALFCKILDIAPILQLLTLVIRGFNSLEQVVDSAFLGVAFRLVVLPVLLAVVFGGLEAVHKCGEELAARILEDEHRHDGRYLSLLAVFA